MGGQHETKVLDFTTRHLHKGPQITEPPGSPVFIKSTCEAAGFARSCDHLISQIHFANFQTADHIHTVAIFL